jgi:hypothetical protein
MNLQHILELKFGVIHAWCDPDTAAEHGTKCGRKPTGNARLDELNKTPHRKDVAEESHHGKTDPSKFGLGTRQKPIAVDNIKDAIRLISKGKVVEFKDVNEVHTLLDKLAAMAAKAKAAGVEDDRKYDLCLVTVKNSNIFCSESLGIKRIDMPQFSGTPRPGSDADKLPKDKKGGVDAAGEFIKHLKTMSITATEETVPAAHLRASQRELIGSKVAGMMTVVGKKLADTPIFVARDNFVIDGHHRWAALVGLDAEDKQLGDLQMKVIKLDSPISEILKLGNEWSKKFGIESKGV